MRILVSSDLHLVQRVWPSRRQVENDSFRSLKQIIDLAISYNVDAIILAGDIFHSTRPSDRDVYIAVEQFKRLTCPILYVNGNHDEPTHLGWAGAAGLQNVYHLSPTSPYVISHPADGMSCTISGCDSCSRETVLSLLHSGAFNGAHIVVLHQILRELSADLEHAYDVSLQDLPVCKEHPVVYVLGDTHIAYECDMQLTNNDRRLIISPGSTHCTSLSESPNKRVVLIERGPTEPVWSTTSLPLLTRRVMRFNLDTSDSITRFLSTVPILRAELGAEGSEPDTGWPILDITYVADVNAGQLLREATDGWAVLIERPVSPIVFDIAPDRPSADLTSVINSLGCTNERVRQAVSRLYTCEQPADAVRELVKELGI